MTSTTDQPVDSGSTTATGSNLTVAVLGLGEVGRIYGAALRSVGHDVRGYDPFVTGDVEGVAVAASMAEAVEHADVVLTLTAAAASRSVATEAVNHLKQGATYVDFTSSGPDAKRSLTDVFAGRPDVALVDVAILGPVVQLGAATPLMAAGPAAQTVVSLMEPLKAKVSVVDGGLGDAMAHKLLRSVFMKGLAAAVTEAVTAGKAIGFETWIREQIARELAGDGQRTIDRLLRGSVLHARRRADEMEAAVAFLTDLGVDSTMSAATARHLAQLQDS
jgi:3-hydroxyisobutyrate dehydrogenase-like beta-hydroxyacid dehydrogenase